MRFVIAWKPSQLSPILDLMALYKSHCAPLPSYTSSGIWDQAGVGMFKRERPKSMIVVCKDVYVGDK